MNLTESIPFFAATALLLTSVVFIPFIARGLKDNKLKSIDDRSLSWIIDVPQLVTILLLPALGIVVLKEEAAPVVLVVALIVCIVGTLWVGNIGPLRYRPISIRKYTVSPISLIGALLNLLVGLAFLRFYQAPPPQIASAPEIVTSLRTSDGFSNHPNPDIPQLFQFHVTVDRAQSEFGGRLIFIANRPLSDGASDTINDGPVTFSSEPCRPTNDEKDWLCGGVFLGMPTEVGKEYRIFAVLADSAAVQTILTSNGEKMNNPGTEPAQSELFTRP